MKYVIEIEDVPFSKVRFGDDAQNLNLYRAKGFNALVFDKEGLDKLTSLDKEVDEAYQKGLEEGKKQGADKAWECAKRFVWKTSLNDAASMGFIVEKEAAEILKNYTATAAMKAVELYDEKLKAEAEIKVGDEVEAYSGKAIVFYTSINTTGDIVCNYWYPSENRFDRDKAKNLKKTGHHFPQIVELFEEIKGEQSGQRRSCSTCKYYDGSDVSKCSVCYIPKGYSMWEPKEGAE